MLDAEVQELKNSLRKQAHSNRNGQEDKDELSRRICGAFMSLPEYAMANTVMFYVDDRSEVRTRTELPAALASGKGVIVPWCNDEGELELFRLTDRDELEIGMYKILEPKKELRSHSERQVDVKEIDLVMVPGVGFDAKGARMGHGKGYYDKLLKHTRPDTPLIALAFECQMFEEIPVTSHDVYMDKVVTEERVYEGLGRK